MNFLTIFISTIVYCYRFIRFAFATFFDAVTSAFINYFSFSGRASRSQFWYFFLFCILLYLFTLSLSIEGLEKVISGADSSQESSREILTYLVTSWFGLSVMITFIPQITLSIRRLHDIGKSGWWYVGLQIVPSLMPNVFPFQFIAIMALFVFIYFMALEGEEDNSYGPSKLQK